MNDMPIKIAKKLSKPSAKNVGPSDLLSFDLDDTALITPIVEEIDTKSDPVINLVLATSKSITVSDTESLSYAAKFIRKVIRKIIARVKAKSDPNIANWKKGLDESKAEKKALMDPLEEAERIIESKIKSYQIAIEKEKERQEKLRLEHHKSESSAAFEEQVASLLESGDPENLREAKELINEKIQREEAGDGGSNLDHIIAPSNIKPEKVEGMSTKKRTKFRIVDESKIPRKFMKPDEKAIGEMVKLHGKTAEGIIPGIEVYQESQLSFYED